jgi:predicted small lipoprotein YifL
MKRSLSVILLLFALVFSPACGKKGPLEPPLLRIPQTVENFSLSQRGDKFVLSWTNPSACVDGSPMKEVSEVEIWLMEEDSKEAGQGNINRQEFEKKARLAVRLPREKLSLLQGTGKESSRLSFIYRPEKGINSQQIYIFALRVRDERRRTSEFSDLLSLAAQVLPLPPLHVQAAVFENHILIRWDAPPEITDESTPPRVVGYNLFRSSGKESPFLVNSSLIKEIEYKDTDISFGQTYRYFVRAVVSEGPPVLESDDSEVVEVQALDTFPPASPSGLTAIAGTNYIALSWEANKEADVVGYRVWRQEARGAGFTLIALLGPTANSYTDSAVEKNKRYDYAITALDSAGNESQRSASAPAVIK